MTATVFSDFRAHSIDQKRDRDNKHKWEYGVRGSPEHVRPRKQMRKCHMNPREWLKLQEHQSPEEEMTDPIFKDPARQFLEDLPVMDKKQAAPSDTNTNLANNDVTPAPLPPVALGNLVVETGRETEMLVQNEFVILDEHGETTNGRKKLNVLRRAEKTSREVDGYELV